jgi:hypothetical protein
LLSDELDRRAFAEFADLPRASTTARAELDAFETEWVLDRIARMPKAPALTAMQVLPVVDGGWRRVDASRKVPVARHAVRVEVWATLACWSTGRTRRTPAFADRPRRRRRARRGRGDCHGGGRGREDPLPGCGADVALRQDPGSPNETPTAAPTRACQSAGELGNLRQGSLPNALPARVFSGRRRTRNPPHSRDRQYPQGFETPTICSVETCIS